MAGIGFTLAKIAREGGVGGIAGAAAYGAIVSAGPWLVTAVAVAALRAWSAGAIDAEAQSIVQTVLVYAFSLSALAASPVGIVATRMVADRLFVRDAAGVPGIVVAAATIGGAIALPIGLVAFAVLGELSAPRAILATLILAWLTQIWILSPLLTALRRYRTVPIVYLAGIAVTAAALLLLPVTGATAVLAAVAAGIGTTLAVLALVIRRHFADPPVLPAADSIAPKLAMLVAAAGVAGVVAIWIDKWLLWTGPGSIRALGMLRLNPINDIGSFLGLLTMVPGLTLLLVVAETRFDRAFSDMIARCTGTSTLARIEEARGDLIVTMRDALRLLVLVQLLVAALAWVFAVPLFDRIGVDPRAIFAFRQTSLGVVFHLVAIAATVALAYYDLFGRILIVWTVFTIGSAAATLLQWDAGFAAFGWGYMAGAIAGATMGVALVTQATVSLTYLIFVGNNPAVVGQGGRWL
jgi:uncharacterized membrane protein